MDEWLSQHRRLRVFLLLVIFALGAYLRLIALNDISFRGDSLHFWTICRAPNITALDTVTQWEKMGVGQPPLPLTVTRLYIDLFHLPVTFFTLRLPSALFGILSILVMYGIGVRMGGFGSGLLLALLLAVSPFHIQMSQEAYFYASLILGSMMLFRDFLIVLDTMDRPVPMKPHWFVSVFVGFALVIHSQFTGWPAAYLYAGSMLGLFWWRWKKRGQSDAKRDLVWLAALVAVHSVVLVLSPWGPMHVIAKIWSPLKGMYAAVAQRSGENAFSMLWKTAAHFGWGTTPWRLVLTLVVAANGIWSMIRDPAHRLRHAMLGGVLVLNYLIFFVSREATASVYESRYVAGLLPIYLYVYGRGLEDWGWLAARFGTRAAQAGRAFAAVAVVIAVGFLVYPAYLCTKLTGQPAPYLDIVRWTDSHLPKGTPVVIDRWFEPWNEMTAHPSTNVVFTFTVPNEPVETYLRNHWRQVTEDFFKRNPDAAYVELAKTYFEVPSIGPWEWPRQFFANHVIIKNEAGLRLRALGLEGRGDYDSPTTNRLVVDIFYNTRADVMLRMQEQGIRAFPWYGDGWTYEKSGPMGMFRVQTPDFRDWRVLDDEAELQLIDVTVSPLLVFVNIRAAAIGGAKTVQLSNGAQHSFASGQVSTWRVGPFELKPGINILTLRDPLWRLGRSPLFVEGVTIEESPGDRASAEALPPGPTSP